MSRSTRVGRLEQKSGQGFWVIVPTGIEFDGYETALSAGNASLAQIQYRHCGKVESVDRLEDEEFAALEARASQLARTTFAGAIVMPFRIRDIL